VARCSARVRSPGGMDGRPGRRWVVVQWRATSRRCQRRIVAGVTSRPARRWPGSQRISAAIDAGRPRTSVVAGCGGSGRRPGGAARGSRRPCPPLIGRAEPSSPRAGSRSGRSVGAPPVGSCRAVIRGEPAGHGRGPIFGHPQAPGAGGAGLVERTVVPATPVQVRYALTPLGAELIAALQPLVEWGVRHRHHLRWAALRCTRCPGGDISASGNESDAGDTPSRAPRAAGVTSGSAWAMGGGIDRHGWSNPGARHRASLRWTYLNCAELPGLCSAFSVSAGQCAAVTVLAVKGSGVRIPSAPLLHPKPRHLSSAG
jgi:hypothetical protein